MEMKTSESTIPSKDFVTTNDYGDFGQETRCYTCTFCKRGFSNAQALGGHMNVHRRDRARLHLPIQETLITTETAKGVDLNSIDKLEVQSSDDDKAESLPKRSCSFTKDHGGNFEKQALQLSLWIDTSSHASDSSIRLSKFSSPSSSPITEVDLELRLGMDSDITSRNHVLRD